MPFGKKKSKDEEKNQDVTSDKGNVKNKTQEKIITSNPPPIKSTPSPIEETKTEPVNSIPTTDTEKNTIEFKELPPQEVRTEPEKPVTPVEANAEIKHVFLCVVSGFSV